ncbi:hypothetical protein Tco_1013837 [Tanacetum coccineum]
MAAVSEIPGSLSLRTFAIQKKDLKDYAIIDSGLALEKLFQTVKYAGDNMDRHQLQRIQYLGRRLVYYGMQKHTIVAIFITTEGKYVAAASCCASEVGSGALKWERVYRVGAEGGGEEWGEDKIKQESIRRFGGGDRGLGKGK